jgi:hypothetical protein
MIQTVLEAVRSASAPSEPFLDANAKRRYLAAKRIELRVQIRVLDTPDHFVERSFKSLQDAGDKQWM